MNTKPLLVVLLTALAYLGGCMGTTGPSAADKPQTHEYNLVVHAAISDTMELYEKNDGNYSRVVAITFQDSDTDATAPQTLPGPEIRVKEGDTVVIHLVNPNALSHTLHLHGGLIPWAMDGMDHLTQEPIMQGGEFTYTFPDLKAGTYWYHCHVDGAHHIDLGMYGAFIVEERHPAVKADREYVVMLDEADNCHVHGNTDPVAQASTSGVTSNQEPTPDAQTQLECYYRFLLDNLAQSQAVTTTGQSVNNTVQQPAGGADCPVLQQAVANLPAQERNTFLTLAGCTPAHAHGTPPPQQVPRTWWPETGPVYNPSYNTYLINGKAFPDTPVFPVKQGETVLFRLINAGNEWHAFHLHGHTMWVTAKDGYPWVGGQQGMDTLSIGPGERYDFLVHADNPGLWMMHDQNGLTNTNDNVAPGGMMACMPYDGFMGAPAFEFTRSLDCNTYAIAHILTGHHHPG
jgi:FtsP/CotA-like multicopper oxidase with cupredoxin domain